MSRQAGSRRSSLDPLMDFALLQGLTRTGPPLARLPLMGSLAPTAHKVTDSDLRRAYLTRLCNVSTLSQRLDALLRPIPSRFCFTPVTLMGFALQRLPLLTSRKRLSTPLPLLTLWSATVLTPAIPVTRRSQTPRNDNPSPKSDPLPAACSAPAILRRVPPETASAADGSNAPSGVQT